MTFIGVSLATNWSNDAKDADTIVKHDTVDGPNATVRIQLIALHLQNSNPAFYNGTRVDVHATINRTNRPNDVPACPFQSVEHPCPIPVPHPDDPDDSDPNALPLSCGQMNVSGNPRTDVSGTFSSYLTVYPDIVVVAHTDPPCDVTNPDPQHCAIVDHFQGNSDTLSGSGGQWSVNAPPQYPNSQYFPTQSDPHYYVHSVAGGGLASVFTSGPRGRAFRGTIYGLGFILMVMSLIGMRSAFRRGRVELRPVYLLGLACLAWFAAWKAPHVPTITYAQAAKGDLGFATTSFCHQPNPEEAAMLRHGVVPAGVCQSSTTTTSISHNNSNPF